MSKRTAEGSVKEGVSLSSSQNTATTTTNSNNNINNNKTDVVPLCASCDRCRSRKTKCDGQRPCSNCASKYMKSHKLTRTDLRQWKCGRHDDHNLCGKRILQTFCAMRHILVLWLVRAFCKVVILHPKMDSTPSGAMTSYREGRVADCGVKAAVSFEVLSHFFHPMFLSSIGLSRQTQHWFIHSLSFCPCFSSPSFLIFSIFFHNSIEGIDLDCFECIYSPAKRRGPVPGKVGQARKAEAAAKAAAAAAASEQHHHHQLFQQQQTQQQLFGLGGLAGLAAGPPTGNAAMPATPSNGAAAVAAAVANATGFASGLVSLAAGGGGGGVPNLGNFHTANPLSDQAQIPDTVAAHLSLFQPDSRDGLKLRSYFQLGINELFGFSPLPSDEEYARGTLGLSSLDLVPPSHLRALHAARFAELALGAIAHQEVALALELANAAVWCLRQAIKGESKHNSINNNSGNNNSSDAQHQQQKKKSVLVEFAMIQAFFWLAVFRAFRGDMSRYFQYRRVCLTRLSRLENTHPGTESLLAAMSYLDSWMYMIYNADETSLPEIDRVIPPVPPPAKSGTKNEIELKYNTQCDPVMIASDRQNQMWIQGAPPIYLNHDAPLSAQSLDALACAVRTFCDQANTRFFYMSLDHTSHVNGISSLGISEAVLSTPTSKAIKAHESDLCSRNMVLSAFTLLQQHEALVRSTQREQGHHLIIAALDAFLDNGKEEEAGLFTDAHVQSLLSICNTVTENPLLLFHAGPTYHLVSNAAIMMCHLLNALHAIMADDERDGTSRQMEAVVFGEVMDAFLSLRRLLNTHRRKLPVKFRCHLIPGPKPTVVAAGGSSGKKLLVDVKSTLMCACRGCQGFPLMFCNKAAAVARANENKKRRASEADREADEVEDLAGFDRAIEDMECEFEADDDGLLGYLSNTLST